MVAWAEQVQGRGFLQQLHLIPSCALKNKVRDRPNDPPVYVNTLNSTLVATERALIAIMENYQQRDGSVKIPEALIPYMNGVESIAPNEIFTVSSPQRQSR